jgi:hypothetical protein
MRVFVQDQLSTTPAPAIASTPSVAENLQKIDALQEQAVKLQLRLETRGEEMNQLRERRDAATGADRARLDKQLVAANHDQLVTGIQLSGVRERLAQLQRSADVQSPTTAVVYTPTVSVAPPQARSAFLDSEQMMQLAGGAGMLMIPLVLVFARNLWVRGSRKTETADIESSPRLQRMEQAIEAIAVEVERIGEAQRFATKLLAERPLADVNRVAPGAIPLAGPRREPGSITPH